MEYNLFLGMALISLNIIRIERIDSVGISGEYPMCNQWNSIQTQRLLVNRGLYHLCRIIY